MAERHSRTPGKKIPVSQRLNFYATKKKSESDTSHGNLEVKAQKHPENEATSGQPFLDPNEVFSAVLEYLIENNFINFKFTKYKCKIQNRGESNLVFICDKDDKKTVSLAQIMYKNTNDKINFKNLSENDGSGFQLGKYFDWFRDLEDHAYFDDEVEYSEVGELFVCSNVDFDDDLKCFSKVCINNENDDEKFYKLNLKDSGSKKLLFPTEYITEQEKLAKELVYCIMFDNTTYLVNENLYKFMKKYQIFLVEEVFNSLNNGFSDLFLSENLKLLNLNIFKFRQIFIKELDIFYSNFKDISFLETQADIKFHSKEKTLESIKKQIHLYKEINILDFLRNLSFNFVNYFPVKDKKIKIFPPANIDISQVDVKIDRFLSSLTFVIKTKMKIDTKEFINSNLRRFLKNELNNVMEGKWIGKESLMDKILDKPISFKGQNIILKYIINFQTLNDPDILSEILFKKFPSHIGKEISIKKDMAYIPRKLKNSMSVHKEILKLNKIDMFVIFIKEIDVEYFQRKFTDKDEGFVNIVLGFNKSIRLYHVIGNYNLGFLPFIKSECNVLISNDNELDFITETNIHFLTYENGNLKWNHTVGDFDRIRIYFFDFEDEFYLRELDCVDGPRFIIINGRFGLGKSTLLDNVTRTLTDKKLNKESFWVCNIDLRKYENHLKIKFTRDKTGLSDAYEYIYQCENIDNDFSKFVFNHFLSDNRVILILDGFDELSDYCRDNVIELFECLKYHSNIKQIWITSNSSLVGRLEHCFQMNDSYELQEFEKPAQTTILVEQWKEKYKSCNDEILFNNACKLIQGVKIRNGYYLSFGVPLYLLMLASVFEDEAHIENPSFPETLSLFELYEKYCSKEIFALEHQAKLGTQEEEKDEECLFSLSSKNFVTWQTDIISPSELLSVIEYAVMSMKELVVSKLKLILAVKDNHKFIHHSFREYFLGKFLAYCVEILRNNNADLKVIRDVILNMRNKFVLYVFDMSLINIETCKIFRDVMECNTESINNFTEEDLEKYDPLGRGLLYYALHYHCIDALKFLIRKNISLSFEPFFLNLFEQWRSRNDGRHLSYFNHKSIESLDEMVRLNSCYKEIMLYILRKTDKETCPAILKNSVDLSKESELRHWEIINFWINKFDYNFNTLLEFEDFLTKVKKYNCPLETLMIILFKSIDISKLNKIGQLRIRRHASRLVEYKGTDEFLFGCEENLLNRFLKQCLTTKTNVIKLLFDNLIANYVKEIPPFFTEFDKTSLQFSDYIRKIKKRSDNFTIIVKHFLTNGIKVFYYDFQKYKVSLLKRWSNENNNCFQTVKDTSIKDFQSLECPKHFNKEEMYNLMHEYMQEANFDESTSIYEAVTAIVVHILETSGGIKLLNLTYNFQIAVLDRDLSRVAEYFKEAKELGFLDVVFEASYEFGDKIEKLLDDFEEHVHQKVTSIIDEIDGYFS